MKKVLLLYQCFLGFLWSLFGSDTKTQETLRNVNALLLHFLSDSTKMDKLPDNSGLKTNFQVLECSLRNTSDASLFIK